MTTTSDKGPGAGVDVSVTGTTISIDLNTDAGSASPAGSTAREVVDAINGDPQASSLVIATLTIGAPGANVSGVASGTRITLDGANDETIVPGFVGLGDEANEVVVRFAETLPDDDYRLELLGVSTAASAATDFGTTADGDLTNDVEAKFISRRPGTLGNGTPLVITKSDRGPLAGVVLTLNGATIEIDLNSNATNPTTAAGLRDAMANDPAIDSLVALELTGNQQADIASTAVNPTTLTLTGGFRLPLANVLGQPSAWGPIWPGISSWTWRPR